MGSLSGLSGLSGLSTMWVVGLPPTGPSAEPMAFSRSASGRSWQSSFMCRTYGASAHPEGAPVAGLKPDVTEDAMATPFVFILCYLVD